MKKLALLFCILISQISCIVAQTQVTAVTQYNECLDLKAVVTLFSNSSSVEDFEKSLNNSNLHISNLDLNNDGYADYLRCVEVADGLDRYIIIQAIIDSNLYQDVATIFVTKDTSNVITVQIIGDSYLYGSNYIIQPTFIYYPRIYSWLWCSHWRCWHSPYRYTYYPSWYVRYHTCHYNAYRHHIHTYHSNHRCSYSRVHHPHHRVNHNVTRTYRHSHHSSYNRHNTGNPPRYNSTPSNNSRRPTHYNGQSSHTTRVSTNSVSSQQNNMPNRTTVNTQSSVRRTTYPTTSVRTTTRTTSGHSDNSTATRNINTNTSVRRPQTSHTQSRTVPTSRTVSTSRTSSSHIRR